MTQPMKKYYMLTRSEWAGFVSEIKDNLELFRTLMVEIRADGKRACNYFSAISGSEIDMAVLPNFIADTFDVEVNEDFVVSLSGDSVEERKLKTIKALLIFFIQKMPSLTHLSRYLGECRDGPLGSSKGLYFACAGWNNRRQKRNGRETLPHMYPEILRGIEAVIAEKTRKLKRRLTLRLNPPLPSIPEINQIVDGIFNEWERTGSPESLNSNADEDEELTECDDKGGGPKTTPKKKPGIHGGSLGESDRDEAGQGAGSQEPDGQGVSVETSDGDFVWDRVFALQLDQKISDWSNTTVVCGFEKHELLLYAASIAYPRVTAFLNKFGSKGLKVDTLLDSGREARKEANLQNFDTNDRESFHLSCTPLLTRDKRELLRDQLRTKNPFWIVAPMVVVATNAYSLDFKEHLMKTLDGLKYVQDDYGATYYRASVLCEGMAEEPRSCTDCPIVLLGKRCLSSVCAEKGEEALFRIHTEFMNLFHDATMEVLRSITSEPPPEGYTCWELRYGPKAEAVLSSIGEQGLEEQRNHGLAPSRRKTTRSLPIHGKGVASIEAHFRGMNIDNCEQARPFKTNLHILKAGSNSGYGPHHDGCSCLNSQSHSSQVELGDGYLLPTLTEMVVVTTCLAHEGYLGSTYLEHQIHDGERLSLMETGGRDIHLQSYGCNKPPREHKSNHVFPGNNNAKKTAEQTNRDTGYLRIAITARMHADPIRDKLIYDKRSSEDETDLASLTRARLLSNYNYTNIVTKPGRLEDDDPWDQVLVEREAEKAKRKKNGKKPHQKPLQKAPYFKHLDAADQMRYHAKTLDPNLVPDSGVQRSKRQKTSRQSIGCHSPRGISLRRLYSSFPDGKQTVGRDCRVNQIMLYARKVLCLQLGSSCFRPLFSVDSKPISLGQFIPHSLLLKVERNKPVINPDNPSYLALEHPYKSIPVGIDLWFHFVSELSRFLEKGGLSEEEMELFRAWHMNLPPIITCGSGGSTQDPKNKAVRHTNYNDAYSTSARPQKEVRETHALMEACRLNAPLALMINVENFFSVKREELLGDPLILEAAKFINRKAEGYRKSRPSDPYFCLGYVRIAKYDFGQWGSELKDILAEFKCMPNYVEKNTEYFSFWAEKHYRFYCEWAFPLETNVWLQAQTQHAFEELRLQDNGKVLVDLGKLLSFSKRQRRPGESIPITWLDSRMHINYLSSRGPGEVEQILCQTPKECDLSVDGVFACMYFMACAVAARAQRSLSTQECYALPLVCSGSDSLPDWLRTRATPHPNSDYDLVNVFYLGNAKRLIQWKQEKDKQCDASTLRIGPGLTLSGSDLVARLVVMALSLRLTGKVSELAKFQPTIEEFVGMHLPTYETIEEFGKFVRKAPNSGFFRSQQHPGQIPGCFNSKGKKGLENYVTFLTLFADNRKGNAPPALLKAYLRRETRRVEVRDFIVDQMFKTLPGKPKSNWTQKLTFLAHRSMGDVEMAIPGVFGEVTTDSVGCGPGYAMGIDYCTRQGRKKDRFGLFHVELVLRLCRANPEQLRVMGWVVERQKIYSLRTKREFSPTDTEHICCKIYICFKYYHPSRQGFGQKESSSPHCWPLYDDHLYDWALPVIEEFRDFWETHLKLYEGNGTPILPDVLESPGDSFYTDEEKEEYTELSNLLSNKAAKRFISSCFADTRQDELGSGVVDECGDEEGFYSETEDEDEGPDELVGVGI